MSDCTVPNVSLVAHRPATNSLAIAEHFDKRHDHVLRDIRELIAQCPENFGQSNFGQSTYENEQGKSQPMYHVFFDGFILLVMGYTGKKALLMKLAYIEAFNAMKAKLEAEKALAPAGNHLETLHSIVDGLIRKSGIRDGKGIRLEHLKIWNRFRTHFRIARYAQFPPEKLNEAIEFLIALDLPENRKDAAEVDEKRLPPPRANEHPLDCAYTDDELEMAKANLDATLKELYGIFHRLRDGLLPGPANMEVFEANRSYFVRRMRLGNIAKNEVYAACNALKLAREMLEE